MCTGVLWSAFAGDVMNSGEVGESVCGLQKVKVLGRQVKLGVQMTSLGRSFTCCLMMMEKGYMCKWR